MIQRMSQFIGPALPPHLRTSNPVEPHESNASESKTYGPSLPLSLRKEETSDAKRKVECEQMKCKPAEPNVNEDDCGPCLPQNSVDDSQSYGPALPPHIRQVEPDNGSSSDDDDIVGPMPGPCGSSAGVHHVAEDLDRRAWRMRQKLTEKGESAQPKRETWMLELPPDKALDFGLGPRQFRARAKPDAGDRSLWTDTPEDRKRKATSQEQHSSDDLKQRTTQERDIKMEKLAEKHWKKNKESLLEAHQKKLKKKKKEEKKEKVERRPFDRNVDLQANRFDEAQKKAIFKKAQLLNDRFSRGESKYL